MRSASVCSQAVARWSTIYRLRPRMVKAPSRPRRRPRSSCSRRANAGTRPPAFSSPPGQPCPDANAFVGALTAHTWPRGCARIPRPDNSPKYRHRGRGDLRERHAAQVKAIDERQDVGGRLADLDPQEQPSARRTSPVFGKATRTTGRGYLLINDILACRQRRSSARRRRRRGDQRQQEFDGIDGGQSALFSIRHSSCADRQGPGARPVLETEDPESAVMRADATKQVAGALRATGSRLTRKRTRTSRAGQARERHRGPAGRASFLVAADVLRAASTSRLRVIGTDFPESIELLPPRRRAGARSTRLRSR